ncbi:MAG: DUF4956 domain-containing protein [Bdellovibrionota bacterium]
MFDFGVLNSTTTQMSEFSILFAFCLSFVMGCSIAFTYIKTFRGLSYSRNFIHSLILSPIVTAIAMQAIGDNVARGIGMMGAVSLLRFRTNIKDPRDMFFIFASLALGLAAGAHSYIIAVFGTMAFAAVAFILHKTPFANETYFDGLFRLNLDKTGQDVRGLEAILTNFCQHFYLLNVREVAQGDRVDYTYQIKFKPGKTSHDLVVEAQKLPSAKAVNVMMQETVVDL